MKLRSYVLASLLLFSRSENIPLGGGLAQIPDQEFNKRLKGAIVIKSLIVFMEKISEIEVEK